MRQAIFAAVTAVSAVALGATYAAAQNDQGGHRNARPEASAQAPAAQPMQHNEARGEAQRGAQAQGNPPQTQPGGRSMQHDRTFQDQSAITRNPQAQPGAGAGREQSDRGEVSQQHRAMTPNAQTQFGASAGREKSDRGEVSQHDRAMTPDAQTHWGAAAGREQSDRGEAQHDRAMTPDAQTHWGTAAGREQFDRGTPAQMRTMQQRDLPQTAGTREQRSTITGRFGEHPGVQAGVSVRQHPVATGEFGSGRERFGDNRFGTERFGAERGERPGVQVAIGVTERQRVALRERLAAVPLHRVGHFGFAVSVGAVVPRSVALYPLPMSVAEAVPQFRGYRYIADDDQIVIIQPNTYRVVAAMPFGEIGYGASLPPQHGVRCW